MKNKKTKIICTLGPATDSVKKITELIEAGMDVARLNFSHGNYEHHQKIIANIRKAEEKSGKQIGILQDLQGPKIRVGKTPEINAKHEEVITLPLSIPAIIKDLKVNDLIMVNDGLVELKIQKKLKSALKCEVIREGKINSGNGLNFPTASIKIPTITKKDKEDLKFGLGHDVDFVALSFVKSAKDIKELRKLIKKAKNPPQIIAKIERHEAVKSLKSIIDEADAIMVARGDLGVDIAAEKVPIIQKRIIYLCNKAGKPVITATQVLQSMIKNSRPSRAEISDAANAIFDRTDAIMLSNESAVGKYPVEAAATLSRVALTIEAEIEKHEELIENFSLNRMAPLNATCMNACELAQDIGAKYIISQSNSAYQIAKFRPTTALIIFSEDKNLSRKFSLLWGANKIFTQKLKSTGSSKADEILAILKEEKIIKKGEEIVVVCNSNKQDFISTLKA